ncbi:predicted protein [Sclerotinia sclerotiorum 1980 UF-70]|uniref:Uncharacterized protein n=1 Tax=Sclerotinia sclerotiorum (strain ATCC 18683 / 1980 / Ss-1) TaxID=665079 RepID=A7E6E4_SCLS1|nr:predicted protein [Sclerotinia sclerotiorum 1980 UF-70]EDN91466.1 predicted protein [Sclerotinia sclerotiorum 1980 UF-70]
MRSSNTDIISQSLALCSAMTSYNSQKTLCASENSCWNSGSKESSSEFDQKRDDCLEREKVLEGKPDYVGQIIQRMADSYLHTIVAMNSHCQAIA